MPAFAPSSFSSTTRYCPASSVNGTAARSASPGCRREPTRCGVLGYLRNMRAVVVATTTVALLVFEGGGARFEITAFGETGGFARGAQVVLPRGGQVARVFEQVRADGGQPVVAGHP